MGKRHKKAQEKNVSTYSIVLNRLKELYMNCFTWDNLPSTVDARFIELQLLEKGYILYFNDPVIGDLCLNCTIGGKLNPYFYPIQRRVYSVTGYNAERNITNSVIIFNNYLRRPAVEVLIFYAKKISELERTIDVNVNAQKTPIAIVTDDLQRLTVENMYADFSGNTPVILARSNQTIDDFKAIRTDAPFVSDKLYELKKQYWNEALIYCGIAPISDKKERLLTDEVSAAFQNIEAQRQVMLKSRQYAVKKINEMFGTDISVKFSDSLDIGGNKENEQIYDND